MINIIWAYDKDVSGVKNMMSFLMSLWKLLLNGKMNFYRSLIHKTEFIA